MKFASLIDETFDETMSSYYSSEEYLTLDQDIIKARKELMEHIPKDKAYLLDCFYNAVLGRDSAVATTAYRKGFYSGLQVGYDVFRETR